MKGVDLEKKGTHTTTTTGTNISRSNNSRNNHRSNNASEGGRAKVKKIRRKQMQMQMKKKKKKKRVLMKRRSIPSERVRSENGIEKRVRTLNRLIRNRETDQGLEGLFRDASTYIMSLEMRVRVMQLMFDVLADSSQQHD